MFLHPNMPLALTTLDGKKFVLFAPLPFRLRNGRFLRVRILATTDGLTGRKWYKLYLQTTNSFFPAVAHDGFYRGDIEESFDGGKTWQRMVYPTDQAQAKDEADAALYELCQANFVPEWEAVAIYHAVQEFGQSAWDEDAPLRNRPE